MTTTPAAPIGQGMQHVYALMAKARQYPDAIFLARGDLDFDAPRSVMQETMHALEDEYGELSPPEGLVELRAAIAKQLADFKGLVADPEHEITITNGAQEGLFLAVGALLQPGDEIIYPEPNYSTYGDAISFFGAVKVPVPTTIEEHFAIDVDRVRAAITPRTRALLLVSPNNPTGNVIKRETVEALCALAIEHDLIVISDEIYDHYLYDGTKLTSPAAQPGMHERTLTLNSVSKTYALTGIRVGWISGPAPLTARVRQLKATITSATPAISQRVALAAIAGPQDEADAFYQTIVGRRTMVMNCLDRLGWRYAPPVGGQFVFVDVSSTGMSGMELTSWLVDAAHVVISPGSTFGSGMERFIRITFLQPDDVLAEGLARLEQAVLGLQAALS